MNPGLVNFIPPDIVERMSRPRPAREPANVLAQEGSHMESSWFWRLFLGLAVLSDLIGGGQMLLARERFLGDAAASGSASLFLTLCGLFLFLFAGLTCLILANPARYWPLAWFAAFGRSAAGFASSPSVTRPET